MKFTLNLNENRMALNKIHARARMNAKFNKNRARLGKEFSEDGWMLTEGIGAILFYLIMIGVAAAILYLLFGSSKISQMQQSLSTMTMQIQGLYSGSAEYTGLTNDVALKAGAVPRKLLKGQSIKTPWGGNITVATGADSGTFTIKLEGVKQDDCSKLAAFQLDSWVNVDINGSSFDSTSGVTSAVSSCISANNVLTYTAR